MLAEIRLLARTARELWRSRTAAAVLVVAGDDNLVETFALDGTDTAAVLLTAVRGLKRWPDRIEFQGDVEPFADAARHLAVGLAQLWPRVPELVTHVMIGPPTARVTVQILLDGALAAGASIGERRPIDEHAARLVQ